MRSAVRITSHTRAARLWQPSGRREHTEALTEKAEDDDNHEPAGRMGGRGRERLTLSPLVVSPHRLHSSRLFVGRQDRYHRRPMSKITNRDTAPPRRGLGRRSTRAIAGYAIPRARRSASPAGDAASAHSLAADSMRAASSSRRRRPRSSPLCSTSICGVTRGRDATSSSTSIASANGSKCWWTPDTRWPHERSPPSTRIW